MLTNNRQHVRKESTANIIQNCQKVRFQTFDSYVTVLRACWLGGLNTIKYLQVQIRDKKTYFSLNVANIEHFTIGIGHNDIRCTPTLSGKPYSAKCLTVSMAPALGVCFVSNSSHPLLPFTSISLHKCLFRLGIIPFALEHRKYKIRLVNFLSAFFLCLLPNQYNPLLFIL